MTEARGEERRADEGAPEERLDLLGPDEPDQALGRGRDLARREREEDAVVHVARLRLEPERPAQLLAERHAPRAVHAHAEDRVDHRVAAPQLVGERLHDDAPVVGHAVQHLAGLHEPVAHGRGGARVQAALARRPLRELGRVQPVGGVAAEPPHGEPELERARRVLAAPERDRRRHALRVLDEDPAALHLGDLPGVRAQQEHVAGQALGDELLVERADLQVGVRHEDVEEPGVGDGAARGERQEAAAAARVEPVVDTVPEDPRRDALHLGGERVGERPDHGDEVLAREAPVGRRPGEARVEDVQRERLGGHRGDDLLGEDVERRLGHPDAVELLLADRADDRGRLEQLLALGDDDPALRDPREPVARPPDALERGRDVAGRLELDDQVERPDVDAELERGGRHERVQLAVLEPVLGLQAGAPRERAVVGGDAAVLDAVVEVAGDPLRRAPALAEDERRAVLADELGDLLQRRVPDGLARRREEVVDRRQHPEVELAREAVVHDERVAGGRAGEECQRLLDRAHRRGAADPLRPGARHARVDEGLEALERERQVRAALAAHQRVDLVDDHGAHVGERGPEALARQ